VVAQRRPEHSEDGDQAPIEQSLMAGKSSSEQHRFPLQQRTQKYCQVAVVPDEFAYHPRLPKDGRSPWTVDDVGESLIMA